MVYNLQNECAPLKKYIFQLKNTNQLININVLIFNLSC